MRNNTQNEWHHWWLYILKLEDEKWYVGISTNVQKRFNQHRAGFAGAAWTKRYKPLKIHYVKDLGVVETEKAQLYEGHVTRKYMEKYGDNNVRGGDLTDTGDYIRRFGWLWQAEGYETSAFIVFETLLIIYLVFDKYFF